MSMASLVKEVVGKENGGIILVSDLGVPKYLKHLVYHTVWPSFVLESGAIVVPDILS